MNEKIYKRSRRNIIVLRMIAIVLAAIQFLGYLGSIRNPPVVEGDVVQKTAFYLGYNLLIIIATILFVVSVNAKKKLKQRMENDEIELLGKNE